MTRGDFSSNRVAGTPHPSQAVTRGGRYPISAMGLFLLEEGNCENQASDLWPWLVQRPAECAC